MKNITILNKSFLNKTVLLIAGLVLINSQDSYSKQSLSKQNYRDIKTDLLACKDIASNTERLDCFDTIVKSHNNVTGIVITESIEKSIGTLPITQLTQDVKKIEAADNKQETKQLLIKSNPSNFGMEFSDQDAKIQSFLVGEFTSWKKGMKLKLKNGQVWKVVNARSGYRSMTDPAITISRGFFGSFDAKIEGLNSRAKVKRIK